jgi:hypothetical protein
MPFAQAPRPPVLGPHDIVPMPPLLLKQTWLKAGSSGSAPPVLLTHAAVRHVWGLDVSGGHDPDEVPPAPIATRVVLQLDGGAGGGPTSGGDSRAGGQTQPPLPSGPVPATLLFDSGGGLSRAHLTGRLAGRELQRAVVGLERVGLRRLDASTVALVVARPPGYRPLRPSPVRATGVNAAACRGVHARHTSRPLLCHILCPAEHHPIHPPPLPARRHTAPGLLAPGP